MLNAKVAVGWVLTAAYKCPCSADNVGLIVWSNKCSCVIYFLNLDVGMLFSDSFLDNLGDFFFKCQMAYLVGILDLKPLIS